MPSPSSRTCRQTASGSRQPWMRISVPAGAYLAALSRRLNSTCSKSTASSCSIGRSAGKSTSTRCRARILLARSQRAADDLAEIVERGVGHDRAGFELRHVEQVGDEPVEPFRLLDDRREQIGLLARRRACRRSRFSVSADAEDRGERRLEIVRDRGEQRRAQAVGLDRALGAVHVLDQVDALDGERRLVGQRVEQTALVGGQQRARLVAVDADDADRAAAGAHRQEQALGAGQRVGTAPGRRDRSARPISRRRGRPRRARPPADSRP